MNRMGGAALRLGQASVGERIGACGGSVKPASDGRKQDEPDRTTIVVPRVGRWQMAKYMIQANYSPEGLQGILRDGGSSRVSAVEKMISGLGGSVESFYFAFGGTDVYVIADVPDNVSAA